LGTLYTRKIKPIVPGWLIELDNARLSACMEIKDILSMKTDLQNMAEKIHAVISKNLTVSGISQSNVLDVLRRIPDVNGFGLSFPHFMFAMGNMGLAKKKNLLLHQPRPEGKKDKKTEGGDSSQESGTKGDGEESGAKEDEKTKEQDASGYSLREKVFFSGLLIFEMYETISQIEDIYYKDFIPETVAQEAKRNEQHGIGKNDIGFRKKGEAAWDRPLPPISKVSPYLSPMPFVTTRWKIVKPSAHDAGRRRTMTSNRPIHMMIQPPKDIQGKIRVMENKQRIRQAMIYLASKGDVVASLPYSHFLINISDTFLEKMEEYNHLKPKEKEKIYYNNDLAWIVRHAKDLYRPHGLPSQVAKMPHMILFTDAIRLRTICQHIREQHWHFVCQKQAIFREEVWKRLHVDRIPYGRLRDSFVYSFTTYLPLKAHLPIVHNLSSLPY